MSISMSDLHVPMSWWQILVPALRPYRREIQGWDPGMLRDAIAAIANAK